MALDLLVTPAGGDLMAVRFLRAWAAGRGVSPAGSSESRSAPAAVSAATCGPDAAEAQWRRVCQSLSPSHLAQLEADATPKAQRRRKRMQEWLRSAQLVDWISAQNRKGLAPTARSLLQHRGQILRGGDVLGEDAITAPVRRREKQWLRRWAVRHSVVRGRFKQGAGLSLETLRVKASGASDFRVRMRRNWEAWFAKNWSLRPDLWPPFRARILGQILGPRRLRGIINGVRLVGPKRSPFFARFRVFRGPRRHWRRGAGQTSGKASVRRAGVSSW